MKTEIERIRDQLKCSLNMGGLKSSAEWAVGEIDRLLASLPVGVPDGLEQARRQLSNAIEDVEDGKSAAALPALREAFHFLAQAAAPAAPTVKAEQVQCEECGGNGAGGDHEDDCSKAPSLPAAGSAGEEVEVVAVVRAIGLGRVADPVNADSLYLNRSAGDRLMTVAQCMRMLDQQRAALSAQQSAPAYGSYTTRPAEAVAGIALRQLGDESRWVEIRDLNAHAFPGIGPHDYYPVGTVLRMPAEQQSAPDPAMEQTGKLLVSAAPLRKVLGALIGAPHMIRELQATREPVALFADNPINVLIAEFNAARGGDK